MDMDAEYTMDEELLALSYFDDARRGFARRGTILPDDLESEVIVPGSQMPAIACLAEGMSPADVWAECREDARGTLALIASCLATRGVCDATCDGCQS